MVIDASAVAAILLGEPEADAIERRIAGRHLYAPHLIGFEIANICATRTRREPERATAFLELLDVFADLGVERLDVDVQGVLRLALAQRLTAYDAAYLWLARNLGAPLVTLDRQLAAAASA
jgi:predicted nucleic acid-binding protein